MTRRIVYVAAGVVLAAALVVWESAGEPGAPQVCHHITATGCTP